MAQPNYPLRDKMFLYVYGLPITWLTDTTFSIGVGQARDHFNINDINLFSGVTVNAATNGANGLDVGTLAASTTYGIYVIGDSNSNDTSLQAATVQPVPPIQPPTTITSSTGGFFLPGAGLLSANLVTPVLPLGYDMYRLVGFITTSGASVLLDETISGLGSTRTVTYGAAVATAVVAGNDTMFTNVDLSASVPRAANTVTLLIALTSDAGGTRTAAFRATGSTSAAGQAIVSSPASTTTTTVITIPVHVTGANGIDYLVSNAAAAVAISVLGYSFTP